MQHQVTPFLWFNGNLEEAIQFYSSVFKDAEVFHEQRMGSGGKLFTATFQLGGQKFMALDGGPMHSFTPAVSFFVSCKDQKDVDYYWNKLIEGGSEGRCGWLIDKFGLSWQIIPEALGKSLGNPDPAKAKRAMEAMMKMSKIIVRELEEV